MIFLGHGTQESECDGGPEIEHFIYLQGVNSSEVKMLEHLGFEPLDANYGAIAGVPDSETWVRYEQTMNLVEVTKMNNEPKVMLGGMECEVEGFFTSNHGQKYVAVRPVETDGITVEVPADTVDIVFE